MHFGKRRLFCAIRRGYLRLPSLRAGPCPVLLDLNLDRPGEGIFLQDGRIIKDYLGSRGALSVCVYNTHSWLDEILLSYFYAVPHFLGMSRVAWIQ